MVFEASYARRPLAEGKSVRSALDGRLVHLIDVPVDYSDNDRILNRELPARSAKL